MSEAMSGLNCPADIISKSIDISLENTVNNMGKTLDCLKSSWQKTAWSLSKKKGGFGQGENVLWISFLPASCLCGTSGCLREEERCVLGSEALQDACTQSNSEELLETLPVCVERRVGHIFLSNGPNSQACTMNFRDWLMFSFKTHRMRSTRILLLFLTHTFFSLVLALFEGTLTTQKPKVSEKLLQI